MLAAGSVDPSTREVTRIERGQVLGGKTAMESQVKTQEDYPHAPWVMSSGSWDELGFWVKFLKFVRGLC